jgi:hypothetical protein
LEPEVVLVEGVRQQASPGFAPHNAQTPLEHFVPDAVHAVPVETLVLVLVLQQGLPGPPHAPELQLPLLQVPCSGKQLPPLATQMFEAQHPLFAQPLPAQQIWPGPPQAVPGVSVPPEPPAALPPAPTRVPPDPALPPSTPGGVVTVLVLEPPAPPLPGSTMVPPSPGRIPPFPPSPTVPPLPPPKPLPLESLHPWKVKAQAAATTRKEVTDNHFTALCVRMDKLLGR